MILLPSTLPRERSPDYTDLRFVLSVKEAKWRKWRVSASCFATLS